MLLLFTDFGAEGPYLGQMEAVLHWGVPGHPIINLLSNAPTGDPVRSGYLLSSLSQQFPPGVVFLAIVDPGVGGERRPVVVRADGRWFVGPDNGLFNTLAVQAHTAEWFAIHWRPERLSASFHGRDLFAPVAAALVQSEAAGMLASVPPPELREWPADRPDIIYIDHYGNALTGLRYSSKFDGRVVRARGLRGYGPAIAQGRTFCSVPVGQPLWYCNSMGLVEIAVNGGRADAALNLRIGTGIRFD